jgi:hypothetical protein
MPNCWVSLSVSSPIELGRFAACSSPHSSTTDAGQCAPHRSVHLLALCAGMEGESSSTACGLRVSELPSPLTSVRGDVLRSRVESLLTLFGPHAPCVCCAGTLQQRRALLVSAPPTLSARHCTGQTAAASQRSARAASCRVPLTGTVCPLHVCCKLGFVGTRFACHRYPPVPARLGCSAGLSPHRMRAR